MSLKLVSNFAPACYKIESSYQIRSSSPGHAQRAPKSRLTTKGSLKVHLLLVRHPIIFSRCHSRSSRYLSASSSLVLSRPLCLSHSSAIPIRACSGSSNHMASFSYNSNSSSSASIASTPASTVRSSSPSSFSSASISTSGKRVSLSRHISGINPMSLVDTTGLENSMKLAQLDNLRGYSQNHYAVVQQTEDTEYVPRASARGYQVLREPSWNKGLARVTFFLSWPNRRQS
jgi:hypothetical protein